MVYAQSAKAVEQRRRAFLRKWRLRCPAVATSLEETGDPLFAFLRLPPLQWRSARTTNAVERLRKEFRRCIKTQTVPPWVEPRRSLFARDSGAFTCSRPRPGSLRSIAPAACAASKLARCNARRCRLAPIRSTVARRWSASRNARVPRRNRRTPARPPFGCGGGDDTSNSILAHSRPGRRHVSVDQTS
jgi:hypothetical protein